MPSIGDESREITERREREGEKREKGREREREREMLKQSLDLKNPSLKKICK